MSKSVKTLSLLMALVMIVACFTACGKKEEATIENNGAPLTLNGDKIYPIECEDTLTFWFSGVSIWNQKYENFAETPIGQQVAKSTGIKVEYIHPTQGQEKEQFNIMLASNELPDMVNSTWYSFPGGPEEAIKQDYIYELSDIINSYAPAFKKILADNEDWAKEVKTDAQSYYAFPYIRGREPITKVVWGPIIRRDFLKKYNLEMPVTMDDWDNVLSTFKENGVDVPFGGDMNSMANTFYCAYGSYLGWYQDGGVVKYGAAQPQYKEYLAKMNEWYKNGYIDPDFAVFDSKKHNSNVLNGKTGAFSGYLGSGLGTFIENAKDIAGFDITGTQFPVMKAGDVNAEYSKFNREVDTATSTAISKNCKNIELAARFLDWGYTAEGNEIYNFGVEGESYTWEEKDGEKYPTYTDLVFNNPDDLTISDVLHMYTRAAQSNVPMILDHRYSQQYYAFPQQQEASVEWAKTNMSSHMMPAIYILQEETDKDSEIMASVQTYVDEMSYKFIAGEESLDKFDEYLAQLDAFGLQTSVGFRQSALDRYNSR